jgi:ABC-type nitrate/sulfonate/bicarbonate transport system permease component
MKRVMPSGKKTENNVEHLLITPEKKAEKKRARFLEILSIGIIIAIYEITAHIIVRYVEFGESIMPTIEMIISRSLPNLSIFYGMGGLGVGKFGLEPSYPYALIVILYHTGRTFIRIIGGFIIGIIVGVFGGLLVKASGALRSFITIPMQIVRIIPLMALITLFIAWFGDSEIGYILYIGFGVAVALFINTQNAVDNISPVYQKFARTLGANRFQLFRTVILPAIIPELLGGIKMIVGQAWALSMAAEFISSQNGLGRLVVLARQRFDTGIIIIVLILYVFYTMLFLRLLYWIGDYITRWLPRMEKRR